MALLIKTSLIFLGISAVIAPPPPVKQYPNYNNVAGVPDAGRDKGAVKFLGLKNSTEECMNACLSLGSRRCFTYTYHTEKFEGPYAKNCYGRVDDPMWSPHGQPFVNSGRVLWPCENNMGCSLNGECMSNGDCKCRAEWTGVRCDELVMGAGQKDAGYFYQPNGTKMSSWGGAVLRWEKDNTYHMYLAEMVNHCGIGAWVPNSQVVHAVSHTPTGKYQRSDVVRVPFAHEPDAVRGPDGEFVLYWTENHDQNWHQWFCNCSDGSTPPCKTPPVPFHTYMSYSKSPYGPWSQPVKVLERAELSDTNFAPVILKNGSVVGFSRWWVINNAPFTGSRIHLVLATNWKDPSTYKESPQDLFPNIGGDGIEDPFMYKDKDGYYHAIFHNKYPQNDLYDVGGHAYSMDGIHWEFGGRAYDNNIKFTDGSTFPFARRERPHFVFAEDGVTPVALTTGSQYGGKYGDATYTSLQPVGPMRN